jgi:2-keto-3-deoxy-L-rhamnonate aldolase RhmA
VASMLNGKSQRPVLGLIVKMPAASTIELAGHAGLDFALIDTEHGSNDMAEVEHHIRAADSAGISVLVRVSDAQSPDILRALDAGAAGIVVPHVKSAADVQRAVARTHYPPLGQRSLALSNRAGRYGTRSVDEHLELSRERTALIVQVEDAEALPNVDDILSVEGLTGVFIGPTDLSASLGRPGRLEDPIVADAIDSIADAVLARPDLTLCVIAADEPEAEAWIDRGARMILLNAPALMAQRLRAITEALQGLRQV